MSPKRIYLSPPHMGGAERRYVEEAFDSNFIAPLGPMVDRFEAELCRYAEVGHCAALSSGTGALHLALLILGVRPGDDVICSSFTFAASANPIVYVGATPVFVDSERDTWNMDPVLLEEAIADRKRTTGRLPAAIVLVHLYGMPAKLNEIVSVAERYGIPVIEDAAEALGSCYAAGNHSPRTADGRPDAETGASPAESSRSKHQASHPNTMRSVGTFGVMCVFSFNGNKIITTSGGGALVSDNREYIEKARFLATQARDPAPHYEHSQIGYNYRMSNILAAIGCGQMEVLPDWVRRCRAINRGYRERLGGAPGIAFLTEPDARFFSNFWLTTILVDENEFGSNREAIRLALEAENIESRPLWKPMHLQPMFQKMQSPMYGGAVCEALFRDGLSLPSGVGLTGEDIDRVCGIVRKPPLS